jgi:hypothetical protein
MTIDTTQPGAAPPPPPMPQAPSAPSAASFRDPTTITRVLTIVLWVALALDVIAVASGLLEYNLLQAIQSGSITGSDMTAAADANDFRQRLIGIGQIGMYVITVIVFARWIYVLNANKTPLGAAALSFTPGWAVGWFFIPFANLWKPYQAMKELWLVSADPLRWQQQQRSQLLPWWWFLWLLANILGQLSFRLSFHATDISDIVAANVASDLADSSSVALEAVAIILVGQIARMQLARRPGGGV